jgi:hypothetical protein
MEDGMPDDPTKKEPFGMTDGGKDPNGYSKENDLEDEGREFTRSERKAIRRGQVDMQHMSWLLTLLRKLAVAMTVAAAAWAVAKDSIKQLLGAHS